MFLRFLIAAAAFAALGCSSQPARAWGSDGHRLVAEFAQARLTPAARAEVDKLLASEAGSTMASVSTWADEVRSPLTAAWHFVNFPRDANCSYDGARMCLEGNCVVGALERQTAVLAGPGTTEDRLTALKYVVHFVGDVHQPLHAGYADDRGGNSYQVQTADRGSNLHSVWDSGIVRQWPEGLAGLRAAVDAAASQQPVSGSAAAAAGAAVRATPWAEESCRIVAMPGFYPDNHKLDAEYGTRWSETLAQRLATAGLRLAALLNQALGSR